MITKSPFCNPTERLVQTRPLKARHVEVSAAGSRRSPPETLTNLGSRRSPPETLANLGIAGRGWQPAMRCLLQRSSMNQTAQPAVFLPEAGSELNQDYRGNSQLTEKHGRRVGRRSEKTSWGSRDHFRMWGCLQAHGLSTSHKLQKHKKKVKGGDRCSGLRDLGYDTHSQCVTCVWTWFQTHSLQKASKWNVKMDR